MRLPLTTDYHGYTIREGDRVQVKKEGFGTVTGIWPLDCGTRLGIATESGRYIHRRSTGVYVAPQSRGSN